MGEVVVEGIRLGDRYEFHQDKEGHHLGRASAATLPTLQRHTARQPDCANSGILG
jgi:hypothetical protein